MSAIIEVIGGRNAEQAAAKAGANIRQQQEARKFALHAKAVCMADRVMLQFAMRGGQEMQMCATYFNGKRMTDRTITTWLPSGTLLEVRGA